MQRHHLSPSQYHALTFNPAKLPDLVAAGPVSASVLSKSRNPLVFLLSINKVHSPTADMEWGSLIDVMWTTPELFGREYVVLPPDAPQRPTDAMLAAAKPSQNSLDRQRWWAEFEAVSRNKKVITADLHNEARAAINMLNRNPLALELWQASEKQVALVGDSPILPGTQAKCLFDLLPTAGPFVDAIVDLKETNDVSAYGMVKTTHTFDYVTKMGYYGILAEAAGFGPRPRGILIWQCSSFPYDVHVREIDPADMRIGRQTAINRVNALSKLDPARLERHFDTQLSTLSLNDWQRTQMLSQ